MENLNIILPFSSFFVFLLFFAFLLFLLLYFYEAIISHWPLNCADPFCSHFKLPFSMDYNVQFISFNFPSHPSIHSFTQITGNRCCLCQMYKHLNCLSVLSMFSYSFLSNPTSAYRYDFYIFSPSFLLVSIP